MEELIAVLMAAYFVASVVNLVLLILFCVARWKMFVKAGEAGWKAIIPLYGEYTMFKICWEGKFFWIMLGLMFLYCVLLVAGVAASSAILTIASIIAIIAGAVIMIKMLNRLSHAFGKGTGFTVGLVFLYVFFIMILGFGSAEYQEPTKNV